MLKLTADVATLPDLTPQQQVAGDLVTHCNCLVITSVKNVKAKACVNIQGFFRL